jgi:hypothetical protein
MPDEIPNATAPKDHYAQQGQVLARRERPRPRPSACPLLQ